MKTNSFFWFIWAATMLMLLMLWTDMIYFSTKTITIVSLFVFCLCSLYFLLSKELKLFGIAYVHFVYAAIGAFGFAWIYHLYDTSFIDDMSNWTLRFLYSPQFDRALILSMLTFMIYPLGCELGVRYKKKREQKDTEDSNVIFGRMGICLLGVSALFFITILANGTIHMSMSYDAFRAIMEENELYKILILLYAIGICTTVACGTNVQKKVGWLLFTFTAVVFFMTGNKGEVLYALLCAIGVRRYKGLKINFKLISGLFILAFIVIPLISASRNNGGVASGLNNIALNFTGIFTEIGIQLRCTVYILEDFATNSRDFIMGFSYYNPIVNIFNHIIPGISLTPPVDFNFKEEFASQGFNQIAEGYANLGLLGSMLYFFITSFYLSSKESTKLTPMQLGITASICAELINVSRNKFAFFWGHVLIIYLIYYLTNMIANRVKK